MVTNIGFSPLMMALHLSLTVQGLPNDRFHFFRATNRHEGICSQICPRRAETFGKTTRAPFRSVGVFPANSRRISKSGGSWPHEGFHTDRVWWTWPWNTRLRG